MLCWLQSLLGILTVITMVLPARGDTPMNPVNSDRVILDTLKEVHNRGAELYNTGDHSSAYRMYQGALIVTRPLLGHRVKLQRAVIDGLNEVEKSLADAKLKAFRLHEVIEQVREEIKSELKAGVSLAVPSPIEHSKAAGLVRIGDKPAGDVCVLFFPRGGVAPSAMAVSKAGGEFYLTPNLPPGSYVLALVGSNIPARYQSADTSPVQIELKPGPNQIEAVVKH